MNRGEWNRDRERSEGEKEYLNEIHFWHETIIISKMINDCVLCECVLGALLPSTRDWNNNLRALHKYVHKIDAISLFNWRRRHCVIVIVKRGRKERRRKKIRYTEAKHVRLSVSPLTTWFLYGTIFFIFVALVCIWKITGGRSSNIV